MGQTAGDRQCCRYCGKPISYLRGQAVWVHRGGESRCNPNLAASVRAQPVPKAAQGG